MKLNFEGPINSLSLGNVSLNFLRELLNKNVDLNFFPVADRAEFGAFDQLDEGLRNKIIESAQNRFKNYSPKNPVLKCWHINGSHNRVAEKQYLYTFYEVDSPTEIELSIVKSQEHVFFSSSEAAKIFREAGCENVSYVPLGFDRDFLNAPENKLDGVVHFGLIGKFESRKNTRDLIRIWLNLFGNDKDYQLTVLVGNPFYKEEDMISVLEEALGGRYSNVNILPRLETNTEVAALHKSIDIDLSGLCGNEGWNLPAFNSACLGKVVPLGMGMAHKDWGHGNNIIPIEPSGKRPCYDGIFFQEGAMFNQGNFYQFDPEVVVNSIEKAVSLVKNNNFKLSPRWDLIDEFSYENTVKEILHRINK